eukprot:1151976-Pelagomonas_calceolata.AAC.2
MHLRMMCLGECGGASRAGCSTWISFSCLSLSPQQGMEIGMRGWCKGATVLELRPVGFGYIGWQQRQQDRSLCGYRTSQNWRLYTPSLNDPSDQLCP